VIPLESLAFSPDSGFRQIQDNNDIQSTHNKIGPSLAAQVAAKRYFRGNAAPPYAATCIIDVSFTKKRLANDMNGNANAKWQRKDNSFLFSCNFGCKMSRVAAKIASHNVNVHTDEANRHTFMSFAYFQFTISSVKGISLFFTLN
jgi:hypothetical protein